MKKIIFGIILITLSFVAPVVAALIFLSTMDQGTSFVGPGTREIVIEKPGKYYLWNQYNGTLDGVHYSQSETAPGDAAYTLTKTGTGKDWAFAVGFLVVLFLRFCAIHWGVHLPVFHLSDPVS